MVIQHPQVTEKEAEFGAKAEDGGKKDPRQWLHDKPTAMWPDQKYVNRHVCS